ncbi:MAG TPA: cyanophycinase [Chloroflexia bacterium]|nr:cyanophycinase [Chloroflexia bacterium]
MAQPVLSSAASPAPRGYLLIVGGSERLDRHLRLLRTYLELCNAVPGRRDIVIITSATGHPEALGGEYIRHFREMGWPRDLIHMPPLATREEASDPAVAGIIAGAAGIYMTGGDQVDLVDILQGTAAGDAMWAAYRAGAIVGGTSAGATAIGDPMIARGGGSGELKRGEITLHPGFAFAGTNLIIDTHFGRRGRFPRLVAAIDEHPTAMGIGIDENTALLIRPDSPHAEVLGSGVVYLIECPADPPTADPHYGTIGVAPLTLYILREGQRYELPTSAK